ncbi:MAG TPA: hypothetical protein VL284_03030 [Thermoanaerobaculia bacterium]|nr:hypothetical protein [Thermoanaerobaculia bacterium]
MLAKGQITADEAERLLNALEGTRTDPAEGSPRKPKYLRVLVEGTENGSPLKANVRAPMDLLRAGVRLASLIPPQARTHVNEAMHEHGVHLDLNQIKPENLEQLVDQLGDITVDVDNEGMKVRVFCE